MSLPHTNPVVFCAPTLQSARIASWNHVQQHAKGSLLDPPLVLASPHSFEAWRAISSENTRNALALPRLVAPDLFFARAHGANARQGWLGGVPRLWALAQTLRKIENRLVHLDFDADEPDALRAIASLVAQMRRQNLSALPVGDDPFGRELDGWRAAYDAHLFEVRAFDFEAAPALFARGVGANRAFAFPDVLLVDDLFDISPALELGLGALIKRAPLVCATLALPGGWNDEVARRAREFWTAQGARFEWVETATSSRQLAARALLGEDVPAPEPLADVLLWQAHTPYDEWNRIAAHIRAQLDEGAHAREFCLVLPDAHTQAPLVRASFEAHGVPLDRRERDSSQSPLTARLLRLLVPPPNWNVDALHDLFGDGALLLEWTDESCEKRRFDAGRLRRAHRSIRGENDEAAWRDPVALSLEWESRIARLRDASSGRGDDARASHLADSLDGGDLEGVARLKILLAPLGEALSAPQWARASCEVFSTLCGPLEGDDDIARRARQTLKQLRDAVETVAARAGEDGERTSSRWTSWLRLELSSPAEEEEDEREGVRVLRATDAREAGSRGEREIFVAGLTERAWPTRAPQMPWPASTAKGLQTMREGEPAPLARALHGLARLLATGARLSLSHPSWVNGSEVEASPLVEDLRALFPGARWNELARVETYARPSSRAQWLRRIGARGFDWKRSLDQPEQIHGGADASFQSTVDAASAPQSNFSCGAEAAATDSVDIETLLRFRALDSMRRGRADIHSIGRYDGVLGERGRELLEPLLARDEGRLELSASGAESYARCGLRWFFERVLELGDEEGAEDDLSRAESGDLVHRILHVFRREWSEPLSMESFERARAALENHTKRECERLGLPPVLRRAEARRLLGTAKRDGALVRLLRAECHEADACQTASGTFSEAFHPLVHLQGEAEGQWQLSGPGNGLEQAFRLPMENVVVRGRIDRIDSSPEGAQLLVLDYKTGSASSLPNLHKGSDRLHFQLAVYVLAARHLTQEWPTPPQIATAYLSPRKGFAGVLAPADLLAPSRQKTAMTGAVQGQWLADARLQIERIANLIESGTFNLSLRSTKVARCEWCAQSSLCGQKSSVQVARAAAHEESNVVFFPGAVEWEAPQKT